MPRLIAWTLVILSVAGPLHAQRISTAGFAPPSSCRPDGDSSGACGSPAPVPAQASAGSPAWAIAASAIFPGTGQAILGSDRALLYVAVEAFAWTSYVRHSLDYRRHRDGYRGLAARVARAQFTSVRPNGDFEYYEHMTHYQEAGRYEVVPGGAIDPETDSTTFNGAVWLLARRTYWSNPAVAPDTQSAEWQRAVAFYRARAYDQLYRWSWTHAPQEFSAFIALIGESNDANRRAMLDLGVIIANHVLSTVDAYITIRLRRDARSEGFALEGTFPFPGLSFRAKNRVR
jgi:hypothetical protein